MDPMSTTWKGRYPFRIGAPSFVLPADYGPNVRFLGPALDHVELLFLESGPDSVPSRGLVRELAGLASSLGVAYTVHLPTDLDLGNADRTARQRAWEGMALLMDRIAPLDPAAAALHLNPPRSEGEGAWRRWEDACMESLPSLPMNGSVLAVENLFYPFGRAARVVEAAGLSVCMDTGHLVRTGTDIASFFEAHRQRIRLIHLQGADENREHLALDRLSGEDRATVRGILRGFDRWVTIEVFDRGRLDASLDTLQSILS
jgi:sugar phosphate isomerase/epimerase